MQNISDKKIEGLLKNAKVQPDKDWTKRVSEKIVILEESSVTKNSVHSKHGHNSSIFNIFKIRYMTKLQFASLASVFLVLTTILSGTGIYIFREATKNNPKKSSVETIALSDDQKREIYKNLIQNNSQQIIAQGTAITPSANVSKNDPSYAALGNLQNEDAQNTLRTTEITFTIGPAAENCALFSTFGYFDFQKVVTQDYYSEGINYSKSEALTDQGDLLYYNLGITKANEYVYYVYSGGAYAVKQTIIMDYATAPEMEQLAPDYAPEIDPNETDPLKILASIYGDDVNIVNKVSENGREYYVIQFTYDMPCDTGLNSTSDTHKIIEQMLIDTQTFEIFRSSSYINSVASENLLNTNSFELSTMKITPQEAAGLFVFDYDVEVRESIIEDTGFDPAKEKATLQEYLKTHDLTLVVHQQEGSTINSVSVLDALGFNDDGNYSFYSDRAFYPEGEIGDKLYEMSNMTILSESGFPMPVSSTGVELENGEYVDISEFSGDNIDLDEFVKNYTYYGDSSLFQTQTVTRDDIKIHFDGREIDAKLVTTKIEVSGDVSQETPEIDESFSYTYKIVYFLEGNRVFLINIGEYVDARTLNLVSLHTSDPEDLNLLLAGVERTFEYFENDPLVSPEDVQ